MSYGRRRMEAGKDEAFRAVVTYTYTRHDGTTENVKTIYGPYSLIGTARGQVTANKPKPGGHVSNIDGWVEHTTSEWVRVPDKNQVVFVPLDTPEEAERQKNEQFFDWAVGEVFNQIHAAQMAGVGQPGPRAIRNPFR